MDESQFEVSITLYTLKVAMRIIIKMFQYGMTLYRHGGMEGETKE